MITINIVKIFKTLLYIFTIGFFNVLIMGLLIDKLNIKLTDLVVDSWWKVLIIIFSIGFINIPFWKNI